MTPIPPRQDNWNFCHVQKQLKRFWNNNLCFCTILWVNITTQFMHCQPPTKRGNFSSWALLQKRENIALTLCLMMQYVMLNSVFIVPSCFPSTYIHHDLCFWFHQFPGTSQGSIDSTWWFWRGISDIWFTGIDFPTFRCFRT